MLTRNSEGQKVTICAYYRPTANQDDFKYGIRDLEDVLVFRAENWIRASDGKALTQQGVISKANDAKIENVTRSSDIVVVGKVISSKDTSVDSETGERIRITEYGLRVEALLKGSLDDEIVMFFVADMGTRRPKWASYVPFKLDLGGRWIVFLKHGVNGYYPSSGLNSLLRVVQDKVLYDNVVEYSKGKAGVEQIVRDEAAKER
jgi:hypothetical protein